MVFKIEPLGGLQSLIHSVGGLHEDGIILTVCACKLHNLTFENISVHTCPLGVHVYSVEIGAQLGTECVILS